MAKIERGILLIYYYLFSKLIPKKLTFNVLIRIWKHLGRTRLCFESTCIYSDLLINCCESKLATRNPQIVLLRFFHLHVAQFHLCTPSKNLHDYFQLLLLFVDFLNITDKFFKCTVDNFDSFANNVWL